MGPLLHQYAPKAVAEAMGHPTSAHQILATYRGSKQSNKTHPIGEKDRWGGHYVEGGYEIDGQFFPLLV